MIVCNLCGASLPLQGDKCTRCSGKGISTSSPLRLHSPGSPGSDKWANLYTKTPPASPLGQSKRKPLSPRKVTPSPASETVLDILAPDNGQISLTRVHGCILDPKLCLPRCECCDKDIQPGHKLYSAPRTGPHGLFRGSTMCRDCYTLHFKLGICNLCQLEVLGEKEEGFGGLHVKGRGVIWHARCFVCTGCAVNLAKNEHSLDPNGTPHCLACAIKKEESPKIPPGRSGRYMLPKTSRTASPRASTSSVSVIQHQSPDNHALRNAIAIKAKAGLVLQMKELFETGGR